MKIYKKHNKTFYLQKFMVSFMRNIHRRFAFCPDYYSSSAAPWSISKCSSLGRLSFPCLHTTHWLRSSLFHARRNPLWQVSCWPTWATHVLSKYTLSYIGIAVSDLYMFIASICLNSALNPYNPRFVEEFHTKKILD